MNPQRLLAGLANRIAMLVGRCVLVAVDDSTLMQTVQVRMLGKLYGGVERFQEYGFTSVPMPGAEGVGVAVGGTREHLLTISLDDRRYRLKGLAAGEVALYDDHGQVVKLGRDGIEIFSPLDVTIQGDGDVTVQAGGTARVEAVTAEVVATTVDVQAAGDVTVAAAGTAEISAADVEVNATGDATINAGGIVNLGGPGGQPVARQGDAITITPPAVAAGSSKVFAA